MVPKISSTASDRSQIPPLRIQKQMALPSPNKMNGAPSPRPLAELSPVERRRNSPSYILNSKVPELQTSKRR